MWSAVVLCFLPVVYAATTTFVAPAPAPTATSSNYVGANNGSLPKQTVVAGRQFDRFIQVLLENTDFETVNSSATFATLAKQGILLDQYYAVTHPSEPNYLAFAGGDFWGMHDDNYYHIPPNISTIADLLEAKNISWAGYDENMPTDGFGGFNYSSNNYLNTSAPPYVYYVRKHNPLIIYDSVATNPARAKLVRNFNDFAADINAGALPQWVFVTPSQVNDGHDTDINFINRWLEFWLIPLLNNTNFNDERTLILLTFDENDSYHIANRVYALLLGGAVPDAMYGTTDSTFYTHYSTLSTVQANWALGSLGRSDTNKTLANVFSLVAAVTGYVNMPVTVIPPTNLTGNTPGPLNPDLYVPYTAPDLTAVGAGGGPVFVAPGLNTSFTAANAPPPVNLTAMHQTVPGRLPTPTVQEGSRATSTSASPTTSRASGSRDTKMGGTTLGSVLFGGLMMLFI